MLVEGEGCLGVLGEQRTATINVYSIVTAFGAR